MIKFLRFRLAVMLCAMLLLLLGTDLTYRVAVHSIVNRTLIPTLLDLLSARPGHRRVINQTTTLLFYAAIEIGEWEERQVISGLLDGSNDSDAYWTEFRKELRSWVQNKRFDPRVMVKLGNLVKIPLDRHYKSTTPQELWRSDLGNPNGVVPWWVTAASCCRKPTDH